MDTMLPLEQGDPLTGDCQMTGEITHWRVESSACQRMPYMEASKFVVLLILVRNVSARVTPGGALMVAI
jgi:hypothetical protein